MVEEEAVVRCIGARSQFILEARSQLFWRLEVNCFGGQKSIVWRPEVNCFGGQKSIYKVKISCCILLNTTCYMYVCIGSYILLEIWICCICHILLYLYITARAGSSNL